MAGRSRCIIVGGDPEGFIDYLVNWLARIALIFKIMVFLKNLSGLIPMTSPSALLYDTCYHIYNRGNNHENIFIQERNYTHFLNLHFKYIEPIAEADVTLDFQR